MHLYVYVCMYVCMYACIHTYIYVCIKMNHKQEGITAMHGGWASDIPPVSPIAARAIGLI